MFVIPALAAIVLPAIMCPPIEKINETKFPWNENDLKVMASIGDGCERRNPKLKCPYKFVKRGQTDYYVSCGPELDLPETSGDAGNGK